MRICTLIQSVVSDQGVGIIEADGYMPSPSKVTLFLLQLLLLVGNLKCISHSPFLFFFFFTFFCGAKHESTGYSKATTYTGNIRKSMHIAKKDVQVQKGLERISSSNRMETKIYKANQVKPKRQRVLGSFKLLYHHQSKLLHHLPFKFIAFFNNIKS